MSSLPVESQVRKLEGEEGDEEDGEEEIVQMGNVHQNLPHLTLISWAVTQTFIFRFHTHRHTLPYLPPCASHPASFLSVRPPPFVVSSTACLPSCLPAFLPCSTLTSAAALHPSKLSALPAFPPPRLCSVDSATPPRLPGTMALHKGPGSLLHLRH